MTRKARREREIQGRKALRATLKEPTRLKEWQRRYEEGVKEGRRQGFAVGVAQMKQRVVEAAFQLTYE